MHSVFVAGSRAFSRLDAQVKERLDNIVKQNFAVLVGDANGVDKAVQRYLAERGYRNVVVYCMEDCRNNVGDWPTRPYTAESGARRDRQYYSIKDVAMAKDASCGFMIWDGKSKGTLTNVINLVSADKKVLLYSIPKKHFFTMRTPADLNSALNASGIKDVPAFLASLGMKPLESQHSHFALRS